MFVLRFLFDLSMLTWPRSERERWGADARRLFEDHVADARVRGETPLLIAVAAVWDLLRQGMAMRIAGLRRDGASGSLHEVGPRFARGVARSRRTGLTASIAQDVRFAVRQILVRPGFAAVVILTIAVSIGASTAVFSVADAVLFDPLPYPNPDRIVVVRESSRDVPASQVAPGTFLDWKASTTTLEGLSAYQPTTLTLTGEADAEAIRGAMITADLAPMLAVAPAIGRVFLPEETEPGRDDAVLLSHALWARRFGGDPSIMGRALTLSGRQHRVVGVMPEGFEFPDRETELWIPMTFTRARNPQNRAGRFLDVVGRLAPGASVGEARAELTLVSERFATEYPDAKAGWGARVDPMLDSIVSETRPALVVLLASVGLLMAIASANVAGMLLARGEGRASEVATRVALGANRTRIVRQLTTEAIVLSSIGGVLGLVLGSSSLGLVSVLIGDGVPRVDALRVTPGVAGAAVAVILVTGLVFGLVPAWQASRTGVAQSFRANARNLTAGVKRQRARSVLVSAQVGMAAVLLIGAGLLARSFANRARIDPGFDPAGAVRASVVFPGSMTGEERLPLYEAILERVRNVPGVEAVGSVQAIPTRPTEFPIRFAEEGSQPGPDLPTAEEYQVMPGYFEAMGIPLISGRAFTALDGPDAPEVVIVNETLARRHFAGRDPIGALLRLENSEPDDIREIVGVVGDVRTGSLTTEPGPQVYSPYAQMENPYSNLILVVRSAAPPSTLAEMLKREVAAVRPDLPVSATVALEADLADAVGRERLATWMISTFAAIALGLAILGIYGVVAYSVAQRRQEMGVRMMLGAAPERVLAMMMGSGARLAVSGIAVGVMGAFVATRALTSLLYDVGTTDPTTFVLTPIALGAVALLATYLPARSAARSEALSGLSSD